MDEERKVIADDFVRQLNPETALPVAAIKTLIGVIRRSTNTTIRGMEAELKDAIQLMEDTMEQDNPDNRCDLHPRTTSHQGLVCRDSFTAAAAAAACPSPLGIARPVPRGVLGMFKCEYVSYPIPEEHVNAYLLNSLRCSASRQAPSRMDWLAVVVASLSLPASTTAACVIVLFCCCDIISDERDLTLLVVK